MAQETPNTKGDSKKTELKDLLAEEGPNLRLVGITGNKRANKAAKDALDQNVQSRWSSLIIAKGYRRKADRGGRTNGHIWSQ
jgi:hypothetical protein